MGIAGRGGRVAAPVAGDQAGAVARESILRHGLTGDDEAAQRSQNPAGVTTQILRL